ncbi:immediate early response gene 5 protein-like [Macrobrachium nipponense]|uniref:immediate early response gene 5 protein-like n=1 Tax=Macrobrachium nipponense TaxID=159736 RepID=UPI0030C7BFD2
MTALDPIKQPGLEAQKLISISLGKMAASRVGKSGSSLHKSLLVASVLQRARHVFLEENYHSYHHYRGPTITPVPICPPHVPNKLPTPLTPSCPDSYLQDNDENRCATPQPHEDDASKEETTLAPLTPVVVHRMPLGDTSNYQQQQQRTVALKRRRVSDKETQDAVSSILPKRLKSCASYDDDEEESPLHPSSHHLAGEDQAQECANPSDMFVPISVAENHGLLPVCSTVETSCRGASDCVVRNPTTITTTNNHPLYCTLEPISDDEEDDDDVNSMEVEHITSLVSIFSFGAPRKDLCATQAAREDHAQFTPVALTV